MHAPTQHPARTAHDPTDHQVPEVWAGVECARVRVGRRTVDQLDLTGHARRATDLDLISSLGVRAVRYPVLWERSAPTGLARADWTWTDGRLERLRRLGIRPVVGLLHHGGGPRGMSLLHPGFPTAFGRFAGAVARRYPWLDTYLPINEPLTTARFGGLYGVWQPHARSEDVFARLILAQCLAIRAAMDAVRRIRPDARLVVNEDVGRTFGTRPLAGLVDLLNERRWLTWDLLIGAVRPGHPLWDRLAGTPAADRMLRDLADRPCPPDLLGIDHYLTSDRYLDHRIEAFPPDRRPDPQHAQFVDVEAVRVAGLPAAGMALAIEDTWARYRRPLALTEVALAGGPTDQVAWWAEAWTAATQAQRDGVGVRAVTAWAVLGATDWDSLLCAPNAHYEPGIFDIRTDPPTERLVAEAIRSAARRGHVPPARAGWWRRPDRTLFDAGEVAA